MPDLNKLLNKQVASAINKSLGTLATDATYISITGAYDTTTGEATRTTTTSVACKAAFVSKTDRLALLARLAARGSVDTVESNMPALSAIVPVKTLLDAGVTPKVNDTITHGGTGAVYTVESIKSPGGAYILGLRLP